MLFKELLNNDKILKALDDMGYEQPTQIQKDTISKFKDGKNIVGQSQTGTGKTAAFLIPLLENIDPKKRKVQALILAPTRELANQIREEIFNLTKYMNIRSLAVYGGSSITRQKEILNRGVQIVVGTPGRVIDLIDRGYLKLDNINYFVLDEVDRMLDMGFIDDIDYIWSKLDNIKQTLTFSATFPNEIKNILSKYLGNNYDFIKVSNKITVDNIDHSWSFVPHFEKYNNLLKWLDDHSGKKIIIFTQTKKMVSNLIEKLRKDGFYVDSLHGDMTQRKRFQALDKFKKGKIDILIATDVASRGLNMNNIDLVINYDVPTDPEAYIHRIGRTGRAGKEGKALMMVGKNDKKLLQNIERKNKIKIKKEKTGN